METTQTKSEYERERGKPMPSKLHSVAQTNLLIQLSTYRPRLQSLSELTLRLDGRKLTPDISIYADLEIDSTRDETHVTEPPLVSIEIASPTQGIQDLVDKARFMMEHGVEACWIVQPPIRTITVFTPDMESTTYSSGTITDSATEIEVDLDTVFSLE